MGLIITPSAPIDSPAFTGLPTAPTPSIGDNDISVATTAFVNAEIANDAAPLSHVGATGTAHGLATGAVNGFMSSSDYNKLSGIAINANNYVHPTGDGNLHVPASGSSNSGKVLTATATPGVYTWASAGAGSTTLADLGITATATEINYISDVTSDIQSQLDTKAPIASPTFTGTVTAPTVIGNLTGTATTATGIIGSDTRYNNKAPSSYIGLGADMYLAPTYSRSEFKSISTMGLGSYLTGSYCYVMTHVPWSDISGGVPVQFAYGNGVPCYRIAASNTAWGAWTPINNGGDADKLDGQQGSYYAPIASPALTGVPTAPTAPLGTNNTQVATTAFVLASTSTPSAILETNKNNSIHVWVGTQAEYNAITPDDHTIYSITDDVSAENIDATTLDGHDSTYFAASGHEHGASAVNLTDSGSHFTATDVEGALAELFTSANSGKSAIRSAIGTSEAGANDSFTTLAGYITTDKETMATNLTAKGVSATSTETMACLADKIADISTGGSGEWVYPSEWPAIPTLGSNEIELILSDEQLKAAFSVSTQTSESYSLTIYGDDDDTTTVCDIDGVNVAFGTSVQKSSSTGVSITFTHGSGKPTSNEYTCFRVRIAGTSNGFSVFMPAVHSQDARITYSSVLYLEANCTCDTQITLGGYLSKFPSIKAVKISGQVTSVPEFAYYELMSLESVVLPDSVTTIGQQAFSYDTCLKKINLPISLTTIGNYAFSESCLEDITLPNNLSVIGTNVFSHCINLKKVVCPASLSSLEYQSFNGCSSLEDVTLAEGLTSIGDSSFAYCFSLTKLDLPSTLTNISNYAFGSSGLISLSIPSSVTTLDTSLFTSTQALRTICISPNTSSIASSALASAYALESILNLDSVNITAEQDISISYSYGVETFNATSVALSRFSAVGFDWLKHKLHSFTFSPSSTFSSSSSPQIDISYTSFSSTELNSLFTSLPTLTGKTINITGVSGASTCDRTIATAKGWTVTG